MVSIEKIRAVNLGDLAVIPETTADMWLVIDRDTPVVNATLIFPEFPVDGQIFVLSSKIPVTNLSSDTHGKEIYGFPSTLVAGSLIGWFFDTSSDAWFPYINPALTIAQLGLENVNNTSDLNKPISSATQSALDVKQATLVSATNIKTINGVTLLGSGDLPAPGYVINVQALTSSPADGATIYFGMLPKAPTATAATSKVFIRQAGTIKRAEIYCFSGTAGTAEAWVAHVRKNNTTDTQIASVSLNTSERIFSNTGLNIPMAAGDFFEIKMVNPTWVTNPLTCIFGGYVYIE
jgi:hypothetical protein